MIRLPRTFTSLAVACLLAPPLAAQAAPRTAPPAVTAPARQDSAALSRSPGAPAVRSAGDSAYVALLERVNVQLSQRWGPLDVTVTLMAVVVAVLGLLFAAGTVMAGWLLFRQSREFREQSELSIREHRAVLGAIVETWRRETDAAFEAKMSEYDRSIADQQAKLDALTGGSTDQREQAERDLERLKRAREAASASELEKIGGAGAAPGLAALTGTFPIPGRRLSGFMASERRFCASCGREFPVPEPPTGTAEHAVPGTREVFCAHCGAKNRV